MLFQSIPFDHLTERKLGDMYRLQQQEQTTQLESQTRLFQNGFRVIPGLRASIPSGLHASIENPPPRIQKHWALSSKTVQGPERWPFGTLAAQFGLKWLTGRLLTVQLQTTSTNTVHVVVSLVFIVLEGFLAHQQPPFSSTFTARYTSTYKYMYQPSPKRASTYLTLFHACSLFNFYVHCKGFLFTFSVNLNQFNEFELCQRGKAASFEFQQNQSIMGCNTGMREVCPLTLFVERTHYRVFHMPFPKYPTPRSLPDQEFEKVSSLKTFPDFSSQSDPCLINLLSVAVTPNPGECVWNGKRFPHNSTFHPTFKHFGVVSCINCFCDVGSLMTKQ